MSRRNRPSQDRAARVATNAAAPPAERYDAQVDMHKGGLLGELIPRSDLVPVIDYINDAFAERALVKSISGNAVPFPPNNRGKPGMQSVIVDDMQVIAQGEYWEHPGLLGFDAMRGMVEGTPILNSIVLTRIRQVQRFCRPQMSQDQCGFVIAHVDQNVKLDDEHRDTIQKIQQFVANSGWERDPRRRKRLRRDTFTALAAKIVRDTLTLDAAAIETEWKRNKALGLDGLYAVDGGTIRLCTEDGYDGDDEIFALQVVQGRIRTAYTYEDLIYEARNPRTDVTTCGYGYSETEMLVRVVTYMLNTMTYNGAFFDKNSIPRGVLNIYGNYSTEDLAAFKRYWSSMVRGIDNRHNLPVMASKDRESGANFTEIGGQIDDIQFAKWLSFLTSIACAIYQISPEEIYMESFSSGKSALSGDDTEEKINASNANGLRALLSYIEGIYSDFIVQTFSPLYNMRMVGLDVDDPKNRFELRKMSETWNESRRSLGLDEIDGPLGKAPMNPSLLGVWQQVEGIGQPAPQAGGDFGDADAEGGDQQDDGGDDADGQGGDFGQGGGDDGAGVGADDQGADAGQISPGGATADDMGKAFGLPYLEIYRLGQKT